MEVIDIVEIILDWGGLYNISQDKVRINTHKVGCILGALQRNEDIHPREIRFLNGIIRDNKLQIPEIEIPALV